MDFEPAASSAAGILQIGPIALDRQRYAATIAGRPLDLSPREFQLLRYLMENAGRVVPTAVLLREIWGNRDMRATGRVRTAIYRLRRKLSADPERPNLLRAVPGVAFILDAEPDEDERGPEP